MLQGSIQETFAKEHWEKHGVTVVSYKDQNMAWADLLNGRIDASLVMSAAGRMVFLSKPQGKGFGFIGKPVADDTILSGRIGYGLRKGDERPKKLDAAIDKVRADGTITRLAAKYFPVLTSASNNAFLRRANLRRINPLRWREFFHAFSVANNWIINRFV